MSSGFGTQSVYDPVGAVNSAELGSFVPVGVQQVKSSLLLTCSAWDMQQEHFVLVRTTSVHIQLESHQAAKQNEETQETFMECVLVPVNIFAQHLDVPG